jgi:hypothetical protein
MRRSLQLACALGLTLTIVGCNRGDDDDSGNDPGGGLMPSQICSDLAYEQCDRIWACASEAQRRSLGYDGIKLDCSGNGIEQLECTTTASQSKICAGSGAFSAADAATCSNQLKAADCSDVATKPVSSYAPACGQCALDR